MNWLGWICRLVGHSETWRRRCDGLTVRMQAHCARCGVDLAIEGVRP